MLYVVAGIAAVGLLWAYRRNVAASFMRGETALTRAFRRLRQFVILWTYLSAAVALLRLLGICGAF